MSKNQITESESLLLNHTPMNISDRDIYDGNTKIQWRKTVMPTKSLFAGFPPPKNKTKWKESIEFAIRGDQLLLKKSMQKIASPLDFFDREDDFRWVHRISEIRRSTQKKWLNDLPKALPPKAPITMLGFSKFEHSNAGGPKLDDYTLSPTDILTNDKKKSNVTKAIVAIGLMNENWGYLSSTFPNRSVDWGVSFIQPKNPYKKGFRNTLEQFSYFVEQPNIIMFVVNQHHNFTHPKIISVPLGVEDARLTYRVMQTIGRSKGGRKSNFFLSASSDYAFRPAIRQCILENLGPNLRVSSSLRQDSYLENLARSYLVLGMPGLGGDTYRVWEALALGSVPVVERGMGLDRTYYKLPVLVVDDFYLISDELLRQAYVEAIYRRDEWEYERLTRQYWEHLIYTVSESGSVDLLLQKHPMHAMDINFTRPLVPFDCVALGGCGPGTKRTPIRSCAIDPSVMSIDYRWDWMDPDNN